MKHGSNATYQTHGCRCVPCVDAARAYRAAYKATILQRVTDNPERSTLKHGTRSKYNIESCRCDQCTEAERIYSRMKKREYAAAGRERRKHRGVDKKKDL